MFGLKFGFCKHQVHSLSLELKNASFVLVRLNPFMCLEQLYLIWLRRRRRQRALQANIRSAMSEINRKRLKELLSIPENNVCADCEEPEPNYASITIGVFLCASCVQIHRKLGSHISRTKSLTHDNWDQSNVTFMQETGNIYARSLYEKYVPVYYRRPMAEDAEVLKEQWIRAKYERKEFMNSTDTSYNKGYMEGMLYKKGKEGNKFAPRRFILSQVDGTLKYFVKDKTPKAVISIEELNATFCADKLNKPYSLQLTYPKDGKMRNIYVYTETGKEIVDWYTAIRAATYHNLRVAYPTTPIPEILPLLTQDFLKEGFLHKTGSKVGDEYKKRWFTLHRRVLLYFEDSTDPYAKGEIYLQEKQDGYGLMLGVPVGLKQYKFGFTLITPERKWLLGADSDQERQEWMMALSAVIETRQTPQDYSVIYRQHMRNSYSYKKLRTSTATASLPTGTGNRNSDSSFSGTLRKGKNFFSFG